MRMVSIGLTLCFFLPFQFLMEGWAEKHDFLIYVVEQELQAESLLRSN